MQEITEPTVGDVARDVEKGFKNLHLETSDDDDSTLGLITEVVHTPHFLRFKPLEVIIYFQNIFFLYKFWIIARKKVLHFFFQDVELPDVGSFAKGQLPKPIHTEEDRNWELRRKKKSKHVSFLLQKKNLFEVKNICATKKRI